MRILLLTGLYYTSYNSLYVHCTTSTTLLERLFTVPFGTVQSTYQPVLRACLDVLCANMADGIHGQKVFACAMLTV